MNTDSPLKPLVESHHAELRSAWKLLILLWLLVFAFGAVASCTVYRSPSGEFVGAVGGKGSAGRKDDPILTWDNDASFKDAARVAGTATLAPAIEKGVGAVGDLVTGRNSNEAARIAADKAIKQTTIETEAATAAAAIAAE